MQRREAMKLGLGAGLAVSMAALSGRSWAQEGDANLQFDPEAFTELTTTITTAAGDREVVYHFYKAIPYVARPVDVTYQCLNVSVPIRIDGQAVDASQAPILFANSVGGYMPSSVANANGIDDSPPMGLPPGAAPGGIPGGTPGGAQVESGGNAMLDRGQRVSNAKLALAAGYVVVEPGARGRTLTNSNGDYIGVAPAPIVDLKAAARYISANAGRVPGNTKLMVSSGVSAGGALSALLGASGDNAIYADALAELGAAEGSDVMFASGAWCPITDLEHADMAYEWNWGQNPLPSGSLVDSKLSSALAGLFEGYQASLGLQGLGDFGPLTTRTYGDYLVQTYLAPAATAYLAGLSPTDRESYLAANPNIAWSGGKADFTWEEFLEHVGARRKGVPAFDALDLSTPENNLFGIDQTEARHFTAFSLREAMGDPNAERALDMPGKVIQMNPMPFLREANPTRAKFWWYRVGAKDTDTALTVVGNLTAAAQKLGDDVDTAFYWDAGHGANEDADAFIDWIGVITGYPPFSPPAKPPGGGTQASAIGVA
ncbi:MULTISPECIES: subtype B tannase [unclassified Devosia]|uniref:subtype B tannase n=1 Tax=unclassified Devosia TaxID=196773 RepID=UPI001AED4986|nr:MULTISPECIES: subtype B tannase [unclassified Devosia]